MGDRPSLKVPGGLLAAGEYVIALKNQNVCFTRKMMKTVKSANICSNWDATVMKSGWVGDRNLTQHYKTDLAQISKLFESFTPTVLVQCMCASLFAGCTVTAWNENTVKTKSKMN